MPVYHYKGYRNDGGAATGIIDAESPKVARVKLRKVGVFPTDMVEQGSATAGSTAGIPGRSSTGTGHEVRCIQGSSFFGPGTTTWLLLGKVQSLMRTLSFERVATCLMPASVSL